MHLYLGVKCNVEGIEKYGWYRLSPTVLESAEKGDITVKPMLRPLSSMTEEEAKELISIECEVIEVKKGGIVYTTEDSETGREYLFFTQLDAGRFKWMLSKGFDLFGLIESGLAIDSTLKPV